MPRFDLETTFIRHVVHPVWAKRDHPAYARYRKEFERTQYLSKSDLAELQRKRVQQILQHAFDHCTFYRQRFEEAKLRAQDFGDTGCLTALPALTKTDIQRNMSGLLADNVPENERARNQTGGSTGAPLQFYVDKERLDSRMASTARHDSWAGFEVGDWIAYLWGARLDMLVTPSAWNRMRNRLIYRRVELNTSSIAEQDWVKFIAEVRRIRPSVMLAYAQSAVLFAKYLREHGISDISFSSIITTAEMLLPGQREFLEETLRGKVFNRYGCRELSVIASECESHRGMHVNADALFVEIEPDESLPAPSGKILITDMMNRSMPLIRYEIEDIASWSNGQECECGRKLPLMTALQGRSTDFLTMPDGRKISGPSLTLVIADVCELQHMQIVQNAPDHITLRVVPGRNWETGVEERLRQRLALYLDPRMRLTVEKCSELQIAASGKHRFVINEVSPVAAGSGAAK